MELCPSITTAVTLYLVCFHLGEVNRGDATYYYFGQNANCPGEKVHKVKFHHGILQIGFFCKVLHGVNDWDCHCCKIHFNINKDTGVYDTIPICGLNHEWDSCQS